jgi:single-strand DNA-binding protein
VLNRVELIGHLGEDPEGIEERGKPAARLRLATNYRGGPAVWHDVVVPGKRGQACLNGLRKGSRVYIQGRIRHRRAWDDEEECFGRRTEIVALGDVLFLDRQEESPLEDEDWEREITDEELGIPPGEGNYDPKDTLDDWEP